MIAHTRHVCENVHQLFNSIIHYRDLPTGTCKYHNVSPCPNTEAENNNQEGDIFMLSNKIASVDMWG